MTNDYSLDDENKSEAELPDSLIQDTADAVAEIVSDTGLEVEAEEANSIAKERVEKFTSPLMIQRAAGASSQVSIHGSPSGGVESGRSLKISNILINLKTTAFALPGTLPALLAVYEKNGTPDHVRIAMAGVFALYSWLMILSKALKVPLTQRSAGVLRVMWLYKNDGDDVVSYEGLLEEVNSRFEDYKWERIDGEELLSHLETLERIGCIERDASYGSIRTDRIRWLLKEKVKVTY